MVQRRHQLNQKSSQAAQRAGGKYTKSYYKRPSPKVARALSAIPSVRRRDFSTTAWPGVDKLGASGIAPEWRNARDDCVRAPARPNTPRSSRQDPPSQYYLKSIRIDRGCPQTMQKSTNGTARHHRGCGRGPDQVNTNSTLVNQVTKQINHTSAQIRHRRVHKNHKNGFTVRRQW